MELLYSLLELSKNSIIRWKFRSPLSIVVVWHQITKFNFFKRNLINFLQFGAIKLKELNQIKKIKNADVKNYEEVNQKSKVSILYI